MVNGGAPTSHSDAGDGCPETEAGVVAMVTE